MTGLRATEPAPAVVWLRRDLRLHDHPALHAALGGGRPVVPLFVLDDALLGGRFASPNRAWFLRGCLLALASQLEARGGRLLVVTGRPEDVVPAVAAEVGAVEVHASRDYGPYGRERDRVVADRLASAGVRLHRHPGVLVREPEAVLTKAGARYTVFTPFRRTWSAAPLRDPLPAPDRVPFPADGALAAGPEPTAAALAHPALAIPPTADPATLPAPGEAAARNRLDGWLAAGPDRIDGYAARRDLLAEDGTSRLSADLRWGTLSPTEVVHRTLAGHDPGQAGPAAFVSELAWRDFYAHLSWWEPRIARESFDPRGDRLAWRDDPREVSAWETGRTGYPVVDAAMRQLHATGFMHNRARMIVASFLTRHLLADWRIGERHFMAHLVDGDPASNNGGWQWAASTGADAQPWFRIFNPTAQGDRFDPQGAYVRRWVPELAAVPTALVHRPWTMTAEQQAAAGCRIGQDYPAPIVDHAAGRRRSLAAWDALRSPAGRG